MLIQGDTLVQLLKVENIKADQGELRLDHLDI